MERRTAERLATAYIGFLATAALLWLMFALYFLTVPFSVGSLSEYRGTYLSIAGVVLLFLATHVYAVVLLWRNSPEGRRFAAAALIIDLLPPVLLLVGLAIGMTTRQDMVSVPVVLPIGLLTLAGLLFGIYLFGFNRDIKQVFSASPAPKAPQRAKR